MPQHTPAGVDSTDLGIYLHGEVGLVLAALARLGCAPGKVAQIWASKRCRTVQDGSADPPSRVMSVTTGQQGLWLPALHVVTHIQHAIKKKQPWVNLLVF